MLPNASTLRVRPTQRNRTGRRNRHNLKAKAAIALSRQLPSASNLYRPGMGSPFTMASRGGSCLRQRGGRYRLTSLEVAKISRDVHRFLHQVSAPVDLTLMHSRF